MEDGLQLDEDGGLICPACQGLYLHQERVVVQNRKMEDGEATEFVVEGQQVTTRTRSDREVMGRRDNVYIAFWCEMCGHTTDLHFHQHKGRVFVSWSTPVPQDQGDQQTPEALRLEPRHVAQP